jgi:putative membrane protein
MSPRLAAAAAFLVLILAYYGLRAESRIMWLAEVSPVLIGLPILALTYRRFRFTDLVYGSIFVASVIYAVGGSYGYTRVPLGLLLQHVLDATRNPYDKIAHLAEGFAPALVIREFLVRERTVRTRRAIFFVVLSAVLAIGATSEILEWVAAIYFGRLSDDFLATQGDPFDTQSDLLLDLLGGLAALLFVARFHDRRIEALVREEAGVDGR